MLCPAIVDIVGCTRSFPAPDVILGSLVNNLTIGSDYEQGVEETVIHYFRPTSLALHNDVGVIHFRQAAQELGLLSRHVNKKFFRGQFMWEVKNLISKSS